MICMYPFKLLAFVERICELTNALDRILLSPVIINLIKLAVAVKSTTSGMTNMRNMVNNNQNEGTSVTQRVISAVPMEVQAALQASMELSESVRNSQYLS